MPNLYGGNNAQNPYGIATEFDWVRGIPEYESADWRREGVRMVGDWRYVSDEEFAAFHAFV